MTGLGRIGCLFVVLILGCVSAVRAELLVAGYTPQVHDRFYVGDDKAFLGDAVSPSLDLSGVGKTGSNGPWVTMISPSYFLSSAHYAPAADSTVTFYEDNTTDHPHTYTVANWSYETSIPELGPSDLYLGKLTAPIPASDNIAYYPILMLSGGDIAYLGEQIYVYGLPDRLGTNHIADIFTLDYRNQHTDYTRLMQYFANQFEPNNAFTESGDSGGPSFLVHGGEQTLVGNHYVNDKYNGLPQWSGDSFVPYYVEQLNANMIGEQLTLQIDAIRGDANLDGVVNLIDLGIVGENWGGTGKNWLSGDFNDDGIVNSLDLGAVGDNWHMVYSEMEGAAPDAVPEPTSAVSLFVGLLTMAVLAAQHRKLPPKTCAQDDRTPRAPDRPLTLLRLKSLSP